MPTHILACYKREAKGCQMIQTSPTLVVVGQDLGKMCRPMNMDGLIGYSVHYTSNDMDSDLPERWGWRMKVCFFAASAIPVSVLLSRCFECTCFFKPPSERKF